MRYEPRHVQPVAVLPFFAMQGFQDTSERRPHYDMRIDVKNFRGRWTTAKPPGTLPHQQHESLDSMGRTWEITVNCFNSGDVWDVPSRFAVPLNAGHRPQRSETQTQEVEDVDTRRPSRRSSG